MNLRTIVASAAAGALAVGSTAAVAQAERSSEAIGQEAMGGEAAPWPLLIVGIAALAALVFVIADDGDDAISA